MLNTRSTCKARRPYTLSLPIIVSFMVPNVSPCDLPSISIDSSMPSVGRALCSFWSFLLTHIVSDHNFRARCRNSGPISTHCAAYPHLLDKMGHLARALRDFNCCDACEALYGIAREAGIRKDHPSSPYAPEARTLQLSGRTHGEVWTEDP